MRSTFYGLEIAKTGLFTAQNQLDLTSHNMSNASTVGYTRQRITTQGLPPSFGSTFIATDRSTTAGRGVNPITIEQVRNPFLDYQYRKENATTARLQTKEQYFEYVESLFNNELDALDVATGMSQTYLKFYNALYALTEKPEDGSLRKNLVETANQVTDDMHYYYNRLIEQQRTLDESVRITVTEVNDLSQQIADLNEKIFAYEMDGVSRANDLRDQRNVLLDTLSGIVSIDTREDSSGHLIVSIDGKTLVRHSQYNQLAVEKDVTNPIAGEDDLYGVYWADADGNATSIPVITEQMRLTKGGVEGALAGYLDIRDGKVTGDIGIPYVVDQLNALAAKIAADFNEVHNKGYAIPDSVGGASDTGIDFFDETVAVTAKNLKVSDEILNNLNRIALSSKPITIADDNKNSQLGNGEIALALCGVIYKKDTGGIPNNINSSYMKLLNGISLELNSIHNQAKTQTTMRDHLEEQRKSISSVSLDEEMTNIVRFGHAYNAASRMITAIDEELETLINKMGLVGRS